MPAYQAVLTPEKIWNIVHYVQSLRIDAHEKELVKAGIHVDGLEDARKLMWASLLQSPNHDKINYDVVRTKRRRIEQDHTKRAGDTSS